MNLLAVESSCGSYHAGQQVYDASWVVFISRLGHDGGIACGFASERDAELGRRALEACGVDWSGTLEQIVASIGELKRPSENHYEYCRRIACEALPW